VSVNLDTTHNLRLRYGVVFSVHDRYLKNSSTLGRVPPVKTLLGMPESALLLGGFVLAHAAWSVSDTPDLLCPLAIIERDGKRELHRFEAETQWDAINIGKEALASLGTDASYWAFAREGLFNEHDEKVDVISVDIWARPEQRLITLIQRFEPYAKRQHFRLIGDPEVSLDGEIQQRGDVQELLNTVYRGASQHGKVAVLWKGWHQS
jgi:hypothetical protein